MSLDRGGGPLGLVDWQGSRRTRARRPGVSIWGLLLAACAIGGLGALAAQLLGLVAWTGPLAAAPAALVQQVLGAQFVAGVRAMLGWFAK